MLLTIPPPSKEILPWGHSKSLFAQDCQVLNSLPPCFPLFVFEPPLHPQDEVFKSKHGIQYLSWHAFCQIVSSSKFITLDRSVLHALRIMFISVNDLLLKKSCGSERKYVYWKFKTFELRNTSIRVYYFGDRN